MCCTGHPREHPLASRQSASPSPSSSSSSSRRNEGDSRASESRPRSKPSKQVQTGAHEWAGVVPRPMLRVTTLHASSATATAAYHAQYLTVAPGEVPGVWSGRHSAGLDLSGRVEVDALEMHWRALTQRLGRRWVASCWTGTRPMVGWCGRCRGSMRRSRPKSLSVSWALIGDQHLLDAHGVAVGAALARVERFGSTTRIRADGGRLYPDTNGLTIATFRQTTSRADDPQIHTHAVTSAKVQTPDGRLVCARRRYLKRHQRMSAASTSRCCVPSSRTASVSTGRRSATGRPRSPGSPTSSSRCSRTNCRHRRGARRQARCVPPTSGSGAVAVGARRADP